MRRRRFLASTIGAGVLAGCAENQPNSDRSQPTTDRSPEDGTDETPGGSGTPATEESSDASLPRLHVDGQWLADPDGRRVALHGVNVVDPWWGVNYADTRGKDYWETLRLATDREAGWQTQVVRVPIEPRSIRSAGLDELLETYVDRVVELTRKRDAYVILDYHAIERYDTSEIDRRLRSFWNRVAPRYADQSHVFYEVFNEPTEPGQNGHESWLIWRETAQPWVDLLRDHAPETPIVVGSPRWSSMARFAPEDPFESENIVYSAHVFPSWGAADWEAYFGDPALSVPIFLDEWGYVNVQNEHTEPHMIGTTEGWARPFRRWLETHSNVNWCAWTFDSTWVPNMFDEEWRLLGGNDYMGEFTKQWLADASASHAPNKSDQPTPGTHAPEPPGSLQVRTRTETAISLEWAPATDPDGDAIAQYRIQVGDREPTILRGPRRSIELVALEPGTRYDVQLRAVDETGDRSDPASLTVQTLSPGESRTSIPKTPTAPTIDGSIDDGWTPTTPHPLETWAWGTSSEADVSATWRACWDDRALYVLLSIEDPDAVTDSAEHWQDDNAELYLDLDHSRTQHYDGVNDLHLVYPRDVAAVYPGPNSVTDLDPVEVATTETRAGWRIETAIPWAPYGVAPASGDRIGFDAHVVDDEAGGERDAKRTWQSTDDVSWKRPETLGTVLLGRPP